MIVRDSNDQGGTPVYLDSDNVYGVNAERPIPDDSINFSDGKWHMITVTTHEDGSPGYTIYTDGVLAADVNEGPDLPGPVSVLYICVKFSLLLHLQCVFSEQSLLEQQNGLGYNVGCCNLQPGWSWTNEGRQDYSTVLDIQNCAS